MTIKSNILLHGLKKDMPSVKIIEPFQPTVIDCETKEDFSEIINAEPDKYKEITTQKLNRMFSIPGYKVTICKGEICLRSIKPCEQLSNSSSSNEMDIIKEEIKNIKTAFNELSVQLETLKSLLLTHEN